MLGNFGTNIFYSEIGGMYLHQILERVIKLQNLERHREGRGDDGIGSSVTKSDSTGKKIVESNLDYFLFIQELFSRI